MVTTVWIRKPTAPPAPEVAAPTFPVDGSLHGLRAGIRTDAAWRSWRLIAADWEARLRADGVAEVATVETHGQVGRTGAADRSHISELADAVDFAIVGLGTCGSCTSFAIADAVALEARERPVIAVVTEEFATHGANMARHLGHGDLRILVLPYPLEARPQDELLAISAAAYPRALDLLGVELPPAATLPSVGSTGRPGSSR
jgi:hypothetical protein